MGKVLIRNAVQRKLGYLYYVDGKGNVCEANMSMDDATLKYEYGKDKHTLIAKRVIKKIIPKIRDITSKDYNHFFLYGKYPIKMDWDYVCKKGRKYIIVEVEAGERYSRTHVEGHIFRLYLLTKRHGKKRIEMYWIAKNKPLNSIRSVQEVLQKEFKLSFPKTEYITLK